MSRLSRRRLLTGVGALGAVGALDAFGLEPRWLEVTEHVVPVSGLPTALEGFRIAHVTDAHLTTLGGLEQAIAREVRARGVQLVALTGDLIDAAERLPVLEAWCRELSADGATLLATFGSWEHWGHIDEATLRQSYQRVGARLLVNETAQVDGVALFATDDGLSGAVRWDRLRRDVLGAPARLLLTHSPEHLDRARDVPRFHHTLAGHTHGGQVRLGPLAPVRPPGSGRFVAGAYDTPVGTLWVSRGVGTSVLPARFLCRPELPVFRLVRG